MWAPESATRLAMLLTGEAQMAELPRDVLAQAAAEGMEISQSGLGAILTWVKLAASITPPAANTTTPPTPSPGKSLTRAADWFARL